MNKFSSVSYISCTYVEAACYRMCMLHWRFLPLQSEKCIAVLPIAFNRQFDLSQHSTVPTMIYNCSIGGNFVLLCMHNSGKHVFFNYPSIVHCWTFELMMKAMASPLHLAVHTHHSLTVPIVIQCPFWFPPLTKYGPTHQEGELPYCSRHRPTINLENHEV